MENEMIENEESKEVVSAVGKIYIYLADFIRVLTAGISGIILCITFKE